MPCGITTPTIPLGVRDGDHVLQEGQVAGVGLGRDRAEAVEAVVRVVGGDVAPPLLEAERRIGDHPVVGQQAAASRRSSCGVGE